MEHGGKHIWRNYNLHYKSWAAHGRDAVEETLHRFFYLVMRDKGDMVTGDFNGAAAHLKNVLDDLIDREENKPRVHVIHAYPNSPEIVTILFLSL